MGGLAETDPVAIDQAAYDLTKQQTDKTLSELSYPSMDSKVQLEYGEKNGLGIREYQLVETGY